MRRFGTGIAALLAAAPLAAAPAHYDLRLALEPGAGRLAVTARLTGLPCTSGGLRLHLNRGLTLGAVRVDGRRVVPRLDPPGAPPFWVKAARAIDLPCPRRSVELGYAGPGTLHADGRNQVSAGLTELSLYGAWYPIATLEQPFTWRLRASLGGTMPFATNGVVTADDRRGRIDLRRDTPGDIVLIASPRFRSAHVAAAGGSVRVLYGDDLPATAAARATALATEAAVAAAALTADLGVAVPEATLIFSRRGGPASYARLPLIVTPQAVLTEPPGGRPPALNIRHEVAHFWSRSSGPVDDWISEGFAEYAALALTGAAEGAAARAALRDRMRAASAAAPPGPSILDTGTSDDFAYINRYVRAALLLDRLEAMAGAAPMRAFRRAAFAAQTTAGVEAAARTTLGESAAALLARCLRAAPWPADCSGAP